MRKVFGGVAAMFVASLVLVLGGVTGAAASTDERIVQYEVDITTNADGSAIFREVIQYDFGPNARHGIDRVLPTVQGYNDQNDRRYPLTVLSVTATNASGNYAVSALGSGRQRIRIGDAGHTVTGVHAYTITYRLDGVVNAQAGNDELYWNAIGNEWPVSIDRVDVRVHVPGGAARVQCFAGTTRLDNACQVARIDAATDASAVPIAVFAQQGLAPDQGVTVVVAIPDPGGDATEPQPILIPKGSLAPRTLSDMFALTPLTGGITAALAVLFAALIAPLQYLVGRDRKATGSATDVAFSDQIEHGERVPLHDTTAIPVEFVPPDKLRPGQIGVLRNEVASTQDVSATIVDLAVRGYLRIEEITDGKKVSDYGLVELPAADRKPLLDYEQFLMTELFGGGPTVTLSSLKNKFASSMAKTKGKLNDDAAANGWFAARPDHVRSIWALIGVVVAIAGGVITFFLARESRYGLIGLPVVAAGLAVMVGARWMPRRTPKGTGVYRRLRGFEEFIQNSEKHRAQFAERQNIFTEYLPYAIAFGATKKWANTLSVLGLAPPDTSSWYVGSGLMVWSTFGDRVNSFTAQTASTLTSTPGSSGSSGFSGGFSGGGGGGGGGGSW